MPEHFLSCAAYYRETDGTSSASPGFKAFSLYDVLVGRVLGRQIERMLGDGKCDPRSLKLPVLCFLRWDLARDSGDHNDTSAAPDMGEPSNTRIRSRKRSQLARNESGMFREPDAAGHAGSA